MREPRDLLLFTLLLSLFHPLGFFRSFSRLCSAALLFSTLLFSTLIYSTLLSPSSPIAQLPQLVRIATAVLPRSVSISTLLLRGPADALLRLAFVTAAAATTDI